MLKTHVRSVLNSDASKWDGRCLDVASELLDVVRADSPVPVALEENVVGGCTAIVFINGVVGATLVASYHHRYPADYVDEDGAAMPSSIVGVTGHPPKCNVLTLGVEAGR